MGGILRNEPDRTSRAAPLRDPPRSPKGEEGANARGARDANGASVERTSRSVGGGEAISARVR